MPTCIGSEEIIQPTVLRSQNRLWLLLYAFAPMVTSPIWLRRGLRIFGAAYVVDVVNRQIIIG